jgi:hypothetical protein
MNFSLLAPHLSLKLLKFLLLPWKLSLKSTKRDRWGAKAKNSQVKVPKLSSKWAWLHNQDPQNSWIGSKIEEERPRRSTRDTLIAAMVAWTVTNKPRILTSIHLNKLSLTPFVRRQSVNTHNCDVLGSSSGDGVLAWLFYPRFFFLPSNKKKTPQMTKGGGSFSTHNHITATLSGFLNRREFIHSLC